MISVTIMDGRACPLGQMFIDGQAIMGELTFWLSAIIFGQYFGQTGHNPMDARVTEFAAADAKARFAELLGRAEAGEEIIIRRHGAPVAKLVPVTSKLSTEQRRQRRLAFEDWRDEHGPTLGGGVTIRDLIDEGRR